MRIQFLGTAAFEGIPSLFCKCETCEKAMQKGGKNIRTRTSVLIDQELKVDFPPDTYMHMLRDKIDMEEMKDLIFTHSHSDHLYPEDLVARLQYYAQSQDHVMQVYGNDLTISKINQTLQMNGGVKGKFKLHRIRLFERTQLETAVITALPASHDSMETCHIYYIEKDGKTLLYGHDSGWFSEETWRWLEGKQLDLAILECTTGRSLHRESHMNIDAVLETKQRMTESSILKPESLTVVTHFSHNAHLLHEELEDILAASYYYCL